MRQNDENIAVWLMMAMGFLTLVAWAGNSMESQKKCEAKCAPADAMTPIVGLHDICLCDEGHGKWRRVDIAGSVTGDTSGG